jgi:hypothetical protein
MEQIKNKICHEINMGFRSISIGGKLPSGDYLPKYAKVYKRMWKGVKPIKFYGWEIRNYV